MVLAGYGRLGGRLARQLRAELPAAKDLQLTDRQRAAVELVADRRMTLAEAGAQLGIAESTVWDHLRRAADRLELEKKLATRST